LGVARWRDRRRRRRVNRVGAHTDGAPAVSLQNRRLTPTATLPEPSGLKVRDAGTSTLSQCSPPTTLPTIIPTSAPAGIVKTYWIPHSSSPLQPPPTIAPAPSPTSAPPKKPPMTQVARRPSPHIPAPVLTSSRGRDTRANLVSAPLLRRTTMVSPSIDSSVPVARRSADVTRTRSPGAGAGAGGCWAGRRFTARLRTTANAQ